MDYLPTKEADKRDWYTNLKAEMATNAAALGLAAADVTTLQAICTSNIAAIDASNTAQTAAKTAKAAKDTQLNSGDKQLRAAIKKMKTSAGYTESIGTKLRVIGEDSTIDFATYKPTIKATVMPGKVRVDFVKDTLDGINVYTRLKGQIT